MSKWSRRIIALLLVPVLLAEPLHSFQLSAVSYQQTTCLDLADGCALKAESLLFARQALAPAAVFPLSGKLRARVSNEAANLELSRPATASLGGKEIEVNPVAEFKFQEAATSFKEALSCSRVEDIVLAINKLEPYLERMDADIEQ